MADPLQLAASSYTASKWDEEEWRQFGRETGTSDILNAHPRLYRSLSFGDPDYPDAALEILGELLTRAVEPNSGEAGRMELIADSMPELPLWVADNAPARIKRLFAEYLAARDAAEIPAPWRDEEEEEEAAATPPVDVVLEALEGHDSVAKGEAWVSRTLGVKVPGAPAGVLREPVATVPEADGEQVPDQPSIFIVHGHAEAQMNSIRLLVNRETGILPISLAEEAGQGRTIIDKFEEIASKSSFVIVLLTPDDVGQTVAAHRDGSEPLARARQNVILELGYFIGKIGRKNIVVVNGGVEQPSDIIGLSYVSYPGDNWKYELRNELDAAGLTKRAG